MQGLHWEFSVLVRAIAYKNLSGAATQIGLSQPQLSRIVSKIERELGVVLLDRAAKRKSGWTATAHRLAEVYSKESRRLGSQIQKIVKNQEPDVIKIGTLEGLRDFSIQVAKTLSDQTTTRVFELDVYDLNQLEEFFLKRDLDLIFTSREPGRTKYRYALELGHQRLEVHQDPASSVRVMSSFEFSSGGELGGLDHKQRAMISNSLLVRKEWIKKFGGSGTIPSPIQRGKPVRPDHQPVVLVGQDDLSPSFWAKVLRSTPTM